MKFTLIATPLFATPLVAVTILGYATHVQALPIKFIYADQAQGETTTGLINLTVPRGYDLVLSFLKVGETVTAVRLGDPSRITFGSDGVLCPSNSSPSSARGSCSATGANVIFFRQLQDKQGNGIPFPYLTSSADGSTQATIFTNGPKGRRMYPVLLTLGGSQTPSYTTVALKPEEDKPQPHKVALSVTLDSEPREYSQPLGKKIQQPFVNQSDPTLKSPDIPTHVQPFDSALYSFRTPDSTKIAVPRINSRIMDTPPRELLDITRQPLNPTTVVCLNINEDVGCRVMSSDLVTPADTKNKAVGADAKNNAVRADALDLPGKSSTTQLIDIPTDNLKQDDALFFRQHSSSSTPPLIDASTDNLLTKSPTGPEQSIDDATAVAFGLLVAVQKGRIEPQTRLWDQAQNAIILLRRGASRIDAIRNAGLDTSVFNLLVLWGQTSSFVQEQAPSTTRNIQSDPVVKSRVAPVLQTPPINSFAQITQQDEHQTLLSCLQDYQRYSVKSCKF